MVAEDRKQTFEIIDKLTEKSTPFSFVQAIRLLLNNITSQLQDADPELTRKEIFRKTYQNQT